MADKFSDQYGRKLPLIIAALGYIICSIPCFYFLEHTQSVLWLFPLVIFYCIEQSTTPVVIAEMFPSSARYTGISIGYNFTMALVGGTAPLVNTWLIAKFNNPLLIAYYLILAAAISLGIILIKLPSEFGEKLDLVEGTRRPSQALFEW